jgi:TolB protein
MYASIAGGNLDLYEIGTDGGAPRRITEHPAREWMGSWSPDMKWIYYQSTRSGEAECFKMPADGGDAVQLTEGGGVNCQVSADGNFFYYTKPGARSPLWKRAVGGGGESLLIPEIQHEDAYALAAAGVYFAVRSEAGRTVIRFLDEETGRTTDVLELPVSAGGPAGLTVSPDGKNLAWSQQNPGAGADLMLIENFR